jgi:hypothetical protein
MMFDLLCRFAITMGLIVASGTATIIYLGIVLQLGWVLTVIAAWALLLLAPFGAAVLVRLTTKPS